MVEVNITTVAIALFTLLGGEALILGVMHFGLRGFQRWFMSDVIGPHIEPMQADLKQVRTEMSVEKAARAEDRAAMKLLAETVAMHGQAIATLQGTVYGSGAKEKQMEAAQ